MLAEHCAMGSTGGTAPLYDGCMRNSTLITLSLFLAPLLACGEDAATRPEDGTVTVWEACRWDGQILPELCEPELVCTYHGICAPSCITALDCPSFAGFTVECGTMEEEQICKPVCNDAKECPKTGGADLECHNAYCIGSP